MIAKENKQIHDINTKKRVGKAITHRRKELQLDILELSNFSGVSSSIISNIENGKSNATINTLEKILDILGLELNVDIKQVRG